MPPVYKNKCLVCLKTGGNLSIFTTYNIYDEKEELYVDVIKNCFNIEITKDSGLHAMCKYCSLKLRHAYIFRHRIIGAVNKLVIAKGSESSEAKSYTDVEYLEEIPFDNKYGVDPVQDEPDITDLDEMSDSEDDCIFGLDNKRDVGDNTKNVQVDNARESDGKNEDTAKTDSLLNIDDRAQTDSLHNLDDRAQIDSSLNLDDRAQTDPLRNLDDRAQTDPLLNLHDRVKTDPLLNIDDRAQTDPLLNLDDRAQTDSLLKLDDRAQTDPLLNLDDRAQTDSLLNLDARTQTDSLLNLDDRAQTDSYLNLDDRARADSLLNLDDRAQADSLLKLDDRAQADSLLNLDNGAQTDSFLNLNDRAQTDSYLNLDDRAQTDCLLNLEDTAKTDSLLNLEDPAKTDSLLDLDDTTLIPFDMEKEANHDKNEIPYFMDLDNVLQVNMHITNDVMKDEGVILNGHDEPYSLSILNENDLNTFLMEETDMKVLNIGGNSFKDIAKHDSDMNPETVLNTDGIYIPFVFNHEIDKNDFIKVADVTVKDEDKGNKTKPKTTTKVVRKKDNKTDVVINPVNDTLEKNNENKTNVHNDVDNLAMKETETKAKKARKRKAKSNAVQDETGITQKIDENKTDSSMGNDLLEKEVKGKKGKKTARKGKKDADTVKENVPGEDDKPKKRRRKEPEDKATPLLITPGQTVCTACDAQFETNAELAVHVKTHRPEFVCPTCGLKFDRKTKLTIHTRTHNGPFYCKFCKQEFANVNTRNAHEWRVHSKPEPFKCSHCGERFKTFLKRLRHLQAVHKDNTQYPCGFCEKTFAYSAYRSKHIEIVHFNKREYKCEKCPASFARRGGLDGHLASKHGIGEMKYQCHVCKRKFFLQTALRWHVSTIHNRHACTECGDKFDTPAALEQHAKMHDKSDLDISLGIDFSTLPLDDYGIMDSSYFDLNELEV